MYRLELTPRAQRELDALSEADFQRIVPVLEALQENPRPRGVLKLRRPIHRVRVGPWRIIYAVFDRNQLVLVGKVARRREDTYNDLERLF